jgi:pimeloyl-ACP methyl ester carboxylesterase
MKGHVDYLAKIGYFALTFDPPGTWKSPGDIRLYTTTNYLRAIDELINHFGNKPTIVIGHSRGATMAMLAASANPHIVAYVSIMSSFTNIGFGDKRDEAWKKKGYIVSMRDLPPGGGPKEKRFELPYSFFEDQVPYKMTREIKESVKPKLIILGKKDTLVPPESVRETYDLLSKPKEIYELDSEHDYRYSQKSIEEVNKVVGAFLKRNHL